MTLEYIKNISTFIVFAAIVRFASEYLGSDYLILFLDKNLITILIALLAINTTTGSVVMTKLREITDKNGVNFSETIKNLKLSIFEQVFLIVIALVLLVLVHSPIFMALFTYSKSLVEILLIAVFIASLYNLYDTANSIFIILNNEDAH
ncbi:hypothetical protein [uncultured Gilvimarinus sp.]|uniref:hypothetical protein n=1 Tax=uncultured Gilvimarinus sp. TaxID=1689143 RepID=UPI0030ECC0B0|tara:strand:- start:3559 stop:4005 length:447 start_codon:yes stop_codon:yes gene_type:complete